MFMRNALKPALRYRSLSTSSFTRNAVKSQKQSKCGNLLAVKLRPATSRLVPQESSRKPTLRNMFLIATASKGVSIFPNLMKKNKILIYVSKIRGLRILTHLQFTDDQPPGTYQQGSHGHEKILAEQQRQLEELKNKQKQKEGFKKWGEDKPEFPKYKPKG